MATKTFKGTMLVFFFRNKGGPQDFSVLNYDNSVNNPKYQLVGTILFQTAVKSLKN